MTSCNEPGEFRITGDDITEEEARLLEAHGPLEMTRIIIQLTEQLKEAEADNAELQRVCKEQTEVIAELEDQVRSTLSKD